MVSKHELACHRVDLERKGTQLKCTCFFILVHVHVTTRKTTTLGGIREPSDLWQLLQRL